MASMASRSAARSQSRSPTRLLTYAARQLSIAEYLQVPFYPFTGELTVVCSALVGAGLGFLWFNCHPAKVFMGDTGSLAIGGLIGVVAICCKQELLLAVVGGVFVIEAVSVILQVLSFKLTGKRIFAMSPIHHHFELSGWKENTVIVRFWILSGDLCAARTGDTEAEVKMGRYENKKVAVLGAGLSGTAAALLLAAARARKSPFSIAPRRISY